MVAPTDDQIKQMVPDDDAREMLKRFRRAREDKKELIEEMQEDFEYSAGKQWDDTDVEKLRKIGVDALTINKIQPNIFLLSGIQRQNRTDFRAYPEGQEDSILAEITTRLIKNAMHRSHGEYKISEVFEDGIQCGEGDIQVTVDYTHDLINGELKLKKCIPFNVYIDPDSTEYDLSDAEYIFKLTTDLSEDQVIKLFPDKEKEIKEISYGKISIDKLDKDGVVQAEDYREKISDYNGSDPNWFDEKTFDLLEMEYKKYVTKYIVVDLSLGDYKMIDSKQEADSYAEEVNAQSGQEVVKVLKRSVPEIWVRVMIGTQVVDDYISPYYPKWKGFSIIPFFAHRLTVPIDDKKCMLQGIVRSMKPLQREINKRRTQSLRHLNATANSGWMGEDGSFVEENNWQKYGATPGILLKYKKGSLNPPQRINPAPISQGHELLARESAEDIKAVSGINADLLAMEDKSASGRAIYLRQQQGIVMVQRILDNFQHTKRLLGKFILSQLGELYSVETAARVLGDNFMRKNFSVPIHEIAAKVVQKRSENQAYEMTAEEAKIVQQVNDWSSSGNPMPVMDDRNEMVVAVDKDAAGLVINQVLSDADITKYDVSVGEAQSSETIKLANYTMLMDLMERGVPIPPEILIEESMLNNESKVAIRQSIERQQQLVAQQQGAA